MGALLMATKKKEKTSSPEVTPGVVPGAAESEEPYTSTRLYLKDSKKLSRLSSLRDENNIALTFREVFGKALDSALAAAAKNTVSDIEGPRAD
jgi:hypothetical protein